MKWGEDDCGHHPEWSDDQGVCHHPICVQQAEGGAA